MLPTCHCEERSDVAISQYTVASWESHRRKRNCLPEIATSAVGLLAMTIRGHPRFIGSLLITPVRHGASRTPPPTRCVRSAIVPPNPGPAWRSLSAATDAIGACRFIDSLFVSTASPTTIIGNFPIFCSLDPYPLVYFSEFFPN